MHIRSASADDFEAVARLTNHYIVHTPIHFGSEPVTGDALRAAWESGQGRYPFLVAVGAAGAPGERPWLMGYAKAGRWRERAAYDRTAEVGIYVDPTVHGRGTGRALYAALIEACAAAGFHTLVGGIVLPNAASVALHASAGFERVGVFREVGFKLGAWRDVAWYQKMLAGPTA
jgi:phosphinothricin acetyltransferase